MSLTRNQKDSLRSILFRHLDGIAIALPLLSLHQTRLFDLFSNSDWVKMSDLDQIDLINKGYVQVSLRMLCSQGWLESDNKLGSVDAAFKLSTKGEEACSFLNKYEKAASFLPYCWLWDQFLEAGMPHDLFHRWSKLLQNQNCKPALGPGGVEPELTVADEVDIHIQGMLIGPLWARLGMKGFFQTINGERDPFELSGAGKHWEILIPFFDYLCELKWCSKRKEGVYVFTPIGYFFAKRAAAYGVTVSYIPTFLQVKELLTGDPQILWDRPMHSQEIHVDRVMNVWGSGGAHRSYFKRIDEIIIDLFNRPIDQQPKGIADIGSGDGSFLEHLFDVIYYQTERGKMLEEYPLFLVGADFNEAALVQTNQRLEAADIWAEVIFGDIGDPDQLAIALKKEYKVDLGDLLNVRSFLDHNRMYNVPENKTNKTTSSSMGAFAYRGKLLPNLEVEQSLIEHLGRWAPYVRKFGLLVIELHSLPHTKAAANLGKTAITAYDGTHGFSDQYIIEHEVFIACAKEVGLIPDDQHQTLYPSKELAVVSINLLKAN